MRRDDALQLGEDVLRALEAGRGEWPLSLVREVYVFGSVARGALEPHDLDLCVDRVTFNATIIETGTTSYRLTTTRKTTTPTPKTKP